MRFRMSVVQFRRGRAPYLLLLLLVGSMADAAILKLDATQSYHEVELGTQLFGPVAVFDGTEEGIRGICTADFNNDGYPDLAVAHSNSKPAYPSRVTIFKNMRDGTFDTSGTYPGGPGASSILAADFIGPDGLTDLAVLGGDWGGGFDSLTFLWNSDTGLFHYIQFQVDVDHAQAICGGDFNKDGYPDVAATLCGNSDSVAVVRNFYGIGIFVADYYGSGGACGVDIYAADLNGDSFPDIAVLHHDSFCILFNNNGASFSNPICYSNPNSSSIIGSDVDGDGDCDLMIGGSDGFAVWSNDGSGSYSLAGTYMTSFSPFEIAAADLNYDGHTDLAFTTDTSDSIYAWLNMGDGTFGFNKSYYVGDHSSPLTVIDADLDGLPDLAIGRRSQKDIAVLSNINDLPPNPFSLVSPVDYDALWPTAGYGIIDFLWENSSDPDGDSVWYSLFVSRSPSFHPDSTLVHTGLVQNHFIDTVFTGRYYWNVKAYDKWGAEKWSNETQQLTLICDCHPGDANHDGPLNVGDAVYIINYVFKGGPAPTPYRFCSADANCDCAVNVGDAVYIINYVFKGGPVPCTCETWLSNCGSPLRN